MMPQWIESMECEVGATWPFFGDDVTFHHQEDCRKHALITAFLEGHIQGRIDALETIGGKVVDSLSFSLDQNGVLS